MGLYNSSKTRVQPVFDAHESETRTRSDDHSAGTVTRTTVNGRANVSVAFSSAEPVELLLRDGQLSKDFEEEGWPNVAPAVQGMVTLRPPRLAEVRARSR